MRTWNSGPTTSSRRIHPSPTSADKITAHDTSTDDEALKPSWTTAPATAT